MRLWVDGTPGLEDGPEELAEKAWRSLTSGWIGGPPELPVYTSDGLAVRFRFVHEIPADQKPEHLLPVLPRTPAVLTLAWFWVNVLEGLLWTEGAQIAAVNARREWGRVAGVEVSL